MIAGSNVPDSTDINAGDNARLRGAQASSQFLCASLINKNKVLGYTLYHQVPAYSKINPNDGETDTEGHTD